MTDWRRVTGAILIAAQIAVLSPVKVYGESGNEREYEIAESTALIIGTQGGLVRLGAVQLEIPVGALEEETEIRITRLRKVAETGGAIDNVTRGGGGYRFEPAGQQFKKAVTVRLPYDERLHERENGFENLRTYYYATERGRWEALELVGYDAQAGVVESITTHFTDMINGTLSLPEAAGPVDVNLNSIKGLEAADANAMVGALEGLEGTSDGSASFRIAVAAPAGRAGMTPSVAITYSSGGGIGISGKGFDIQYGSQIAIDTRYGAARYEERYGGKDRYTKDGVLLEEMDTVVGEGVKYRVLRETVSSTIIHKTSGNNNYWEVRENDGRRKIYGQNDESWGGKSAAKKNIWNVEREEDVYGNTIIYRYDTTRAENEHSYVYPSEIRYTGNGKEEGKYRIRFIYDEKGYYGEKNERPDVRLDGRGGYVQAIRKRLDRIAVEALLDGKKEEWRRIRSYEFGYVQGKAAEESYVETLACFDEDDKQAWQYKFEYEELAERDGKLDIFKGTESWGNMTVSQSHSIQGGIQGSMGGGVGIGPTYPGDEDARVSGGGNISSGKGESHSEHTVADINGDGVADIVWQDRDIIKIRLNTPEGLSRDVFEIKIGGLDDTALEQEKNSNFSYGGNIALGIGKKDGGGMSIGITMTTQSGSSRLLCSLQDIDGDGLVDIVESGARSYHKNVSTRGNIQFKKHDLIVDGSFAEYTIELTKEQREKYSEEYYQQRPFRMWKAPYDGEVRLVQEITNKGDGTIIASVYDQAREITAAQVRINGAERQERTTSGIAVTGRDKLYYIHQIEGTGRWDDIRGNDIEWKIKSVYTRVRPWYRDDELIRYLDTSASSGNILENPKKSKQWLYEYGYFIPLIVQKNDFEQFLQSITNKETAEQAAMFYVYDASIQAYRERVWNNKGILGNEDNRRTLEQTISTAMGYRKAEYVNNMRKNGIGLSFVDGEVQHRQQINSVPLDAIRGVGNEGSVLNDGKTLYLGTYDGNTVYINYEDGKWVYYDTDRHGDYEVKKDEDKIQVYKGPKYIPEAELIWEFSNAETRPSYISGAEMELLALDATIGIPGFSRQNYNPNTWHNKTVPELGNWLNEQVNSEKITAEQRVAVLNCYNTKEVTSGDPAKTKIIYELINGKNDTVRNYLKIIERLDYLAFIQQYYVHDDVGGYVLQNENNRNLDVYFRQIIEKYHLIKYRTVNKEIRYNPDYYYAVTENEGERTFSYIALDDANLISKYSTIRLSWDSEIDYSPVNDASDRELTLGGESKIGIGSDDILYGGHNGWYYGIWMGGQRDNPFSHKTLYSLTQFAESQEGEREVPKPTSMEGKNKDQAKSAYNAEQEKQKQAGFNWKGYYLVKPGSKAYTELGKHSGGKPMGEDDPQGRTTKLNNVQRLVGNVAVNLEQSFKWAPSGGRVSTDTALYYFPYIENSLIHTSRAGGASYYEIPGIVTGLNGSSGAMPTLRSSSSEGEDFAFNFGVLSADSNYGFNDGTSWMEQNLMDINGDGIPDIVQAKGKDSNTIYVWYGQYRTDGTVTYGKKETIANAGILGRHTTSTSTFGAGVGPGGSMTSNKKASGVQQSAQVAPKPEDKKSSPVGGSGSSAKGITWQEAGMMDVNGDGLPDYISSEQVQLGTGGGYTEVPIIIPGYLSSGNNDSITKAFSVAGGASSGKDAEAGSDILPDVEEGSDVLPDPAEGSDVLPDVEEGSDVLPDPAEANNVLSEANGNGKDPWTSTNKIYGGISGGLSTSTSINMNTTMMLDVNGDGLPDHVRKYSSDTEHFIVQFNTGSGFTKEKSVNLPAWDNLSDNVWDMQSPSELFSPVARDLPIIGPQVIPIPSFLSTIAYKDFDYLDYSSTVGIGLNGGVNVGGTLSIQMPVSMVLNLTLNGSGGVNGSISHTGVTVRMMDVNGDGLVDQVLRIPYQGTYVKLNKSGEVGLLKKIHLPQGGEYRLNYTSVGNTFEMPQRRYVLSQVDRDDKDHARGGAHVYTTRYSYEGGYYHREYKEFFGFATVITTQADGSMQAVQYHNREYYSKGFETSRRLYNSALSSGKLLRESIQTIDKKPYARPTYSREKQYDEQTRQFIETSRQWMYDDHGNVTYYEETGSGVDDLRATITYRYIPDSHIYNRPSGITVSDHTGTLRRREGTYDGNGALTNLRQYYASGKYLEYKYTYNNYGMMISVQDPAGVKREYTYDSEAHQYITEINLKSATGAAYTSHIQWDKERGQKKRETDANGNSIYYEYDKQGRLFKVYTDYDRQGGTAAVSYHYYTGGYTENGPRWYTVTENKLRYDGGDTSVLLTVAELDGLGRVRRTAKSGAVYDPAGRKHQIGWNVSGAAEYDGKGRTIRTGQTYFIEAKEGDEGVATLLGSTVRMHNPTLNEYDALDRVIRATLPDGSVSTTRYEVTDLDGNMHYRETQTDPLKNIGVKYSDARGNVKRVERLDADGKLLTNARYEYNNMGEMLRALDAEGNPLIVEYDMMGRRLALESADMGRNEYTFNAQGQLESETTSELRQNGKKIIYEYDGFGRNVKILYPYMQSVVYEYGPPSASANNLAGRLVKVTDASGTMEYTYGKLGETVREKRVLKQETGFLGKEREAVMEYVGNYLGQMEKITYPDGEEVSYGYDYGGNVTSVTGYNKGVNFTYVEKIGYDEWGQRVYLKLGNGVETTYKYDEKRRWLDSINTVGNGTVLQNINYWFDAVGNVAKYLNDSGTYMTEQRYTYDALYQLTGVEGESKNFRYGVLTYTARYNQKYQFDEIGLGNMMFKTSETGNTGEKFAGDSLDYQLDYEYITGTRKAQRIGDRYYQYDLNGNLTAEQDEPFVKAGNKGSVEVHQTDNGAYYAEGAWGLDENGTMAGGKDGASSRRDYRWDEKNRLRESTDARYSVKYTYGPDGERTNKYAVSTAGGGESETLYFNRMWNWRYDGLLSSHDGTNSKHIFLGDTRILTKVVSADGSFVPDAERVGQYYYHSDHLGSAQLITDYRGEEYERLEYTPYGELWIEKASPASVLNIPYRFTGKERDSETGLYYYGARYLDSKTSRWISGDPAMGDYVPEVPVSDEARKRNGSLPGMGGVFNYVNLHVYHYAGNNPVRLVDPTGRKIIVIDIKYREIIKHMINSVSADKFDFDEKGNLFKDGNKKNSFLGIGRSKEFSKQLQEGIKSGKLIFIDVTGDIMGIREDGSLGVGDVEEGGGGRTASLSDTMINVSITGKESPREIQMKNGKGKTYNPTEILVHELVGHAIPRATDQHGNAVEKENNVRRQMPDWEERLPDANHTTH